jgi:hypothetical protein
LRWDELDGYWHGCDATNLMDIGMAVPNVCMPNMPKRRKKKVLKNKTSDIITNERRMDRTNTRISAEYTRI